MNNTQNVFNHSAIQDKLLFGSSAHTGYLWENLAIEKRKSVTSIDKLYKGNIVDSLWAVFSSTVT